MKATPFIIVLLGLVALSNAAPTLQITNETELRKSEHFFKKIKKAAKKLGKGVKKIGRGIKKGAKKAGRAIKKGAKKVGRADKKGVKKGLKKIKDEIKKYKLECKYKCVNGDCKTRCSFVRK